MFLIDKVLKLLLPTKDMTEVLIYVFTFIDVERIGIVVPVREVKGDDVGLCYWGKLLLVLGFRIYHGFCCWLIDSCLRQLLTAIIRFPFCLIFTFLCL